MPAIVLALAAVLMLGLPVASAAQPARIELGNWEQFDRWLEAIQRHAPGERDAAVQAVLGLKSDELESVFPYMVFTLRRALGEKQRPADFDALLDRYGTRGHQPRDLDRLKERIDRIVTIGIDAFLKRAAILHADIAIIAPRTHLTVSEGTGHLAHDGISAGDEGRTWHWMLGRSFLHLVGDRDQDRHVRLWYQAVGNHLWATNNFTELMPHLKTAREIFPGDGEIWFLQGLAHESQSAPHIQAAVNAQVSAQARLYAKTSMRYEPSVKSAAAEHAAARDAYRKALQFDPENAEARIRLGRLFSVAGDHDRAETELTLGLAKSSDHRLLYLGQLFLGRAHQLRNHAAAARAAFEAAAALYPKAQSPRLALSQLALLAGDRDGANAVFALLAGPVSDDADPWWRYHFERVPGRDVWLQRMWTAFAGAIE